MGARETTNYEKTCPRKARSSEKGAQEGPKSPPNELPRSVPGSSRTARRPGRPPGEPGSEFSPAGCSETGPPGGARRAKVRPLAHLAAAPCRLVKALDHRVWSLHKHPHAGPLGVGGFRWPAATCRRPPRRTRQAMSRERERRNEMIRDEMWRGGAR